MKLQFTLCPALFFRSKLLYININGIATSYIVYKIYIDILYKFDIPSSPMYLQSNILSWVQLGMQVREVLTLAFP